MGKICLSIVVFLMAVTYARADTVYMQSTTPWGKDAEIAQKIRDECAIQTQLPQFTKEFGSSMGTEIVFSNNLGAQKKAKVLHVSISDAISAGNNWTGHQKSTTIKGSLSVNGKVIASFKGRRVSSGGAFAGYKGSCSVLGRTVKTLGKDIATWLKNPVDGARLGDL